VEIIYLLIPLSLVLVGGIVWAFFWAVKSGQFDDLEGPAHRILMDDDSPGGRTRKPEASAGEDSKDRPSE
jgi:cbb3-type cytochrome oxidase maturation protein